MNRSKILKNAAETLGGMLRKGGWMKWACPQEYPDGCWGKHYQWACSRNKCQARFDGDFEEVCTYGGAGWSSPWGPEPAEYESICPECGRQETIYELDYDNVFVQTKRYAKRFSRN